MTPQLSFTTFAVTAPGTDLLLAEQGHELVTGDQRFGLACPGVWDLLQPHRRPALDQFAADYAAVRIAEHRELTAAEVQTLPIVDPDHPLAEMWDQRARTFEQFCAAIAHVEPGHVIDIGAGCGWLAAHLANAGWQAAAIDVTVEGGDGLAAARYHSTEIFLARAEMQVLPFASDTIDLAVFNASLHYAADVSQALREAVRVVRPGGLLGVIDSPVFRDPTAGRAMVDEFDLHAKRSYGLPAAKLEGPGYVTESDLGALDLEQIDPTRGVRKRLHQWRGARRAGRETATRPLMIATIGHHR